MQRRLTRLALLAAMTLFVALPTVVSGQEKEAAETSILGTWKVNFDKSTDLPDEEKEQMAAMGLALTFAKDGVMIMSVGGNKMEGEFKLTAVEGEEKKFKLSMTMQGRERPADLIMVNKDEIKIDPADDPALVFVRQKEEEKGEEKKEEAKEEKMEEGDAKEMSMDDIKKMAVGEWKVDEEATRNLPDNKDQEIEAVPPLHITMNDDGTAKVGEGSGDMEATYEIRKKEGGEGLEIATTVDGDERTFEFKVVDKDHFAMRPRSSMPFFVFKRQSK